MHHHLQSTLTIQHQCTNSGFCTCLVSDLFSYTQKRHHVMGSAKTSKRRRKNSVTEVGIHDFNRRVLQKRKDLLGTMLLDKDLCSIVFSHLSVKELLLASMACRSFMETIDASKNSPFNWQLRWWGNFSNPWVKKLNTVTCEPDGRAYRSQIAVEGVDVQYMWLLNVVPTKGSRVQMRCGLNLTLDQVELNGNEKAVQRIRDAKFVNIEVVEWEIVKIQYQSTPDTEADRKFKWVRGGELADFRLRVFRFVPSMFHVDVKIKVPITITFQNVPVASEMLSYRKLCVIRCMHNCMHCHQRPRKWVSVDTDVVNHRVLCSLCLHNFYVEEKLMARKYKCPLDGRTPRQRRSMHCTRSSKDPPLLHSDTSENLRVHYVEAYHGMPSRVHSNVPLVVMDKTRVAQRFGFASWTEFLALNYRRPKTLGDSRLSPYLFCTQFSTW
jgi:hypothetical protein